MSEKPKADRASWAPGEILYGDGDVAINAGAERCALAIVNTGDRPVQVGSHVHLPQPNAALEFDRAAAQRPPARHSRRHRDALRTRCRPACFHGAAERITRYAAGSATLESHGIWTLEVAGDLDVDPQPTVVAANARHFTTTRLQLTNSGRVRLRERIQIGRSNERQGFWSGSLHADVDGSPLLRHRIELGNGSVADDELGMPLACVSELHYPDSDVDTAGVALILAGGGCLSTWQGQRL